MKIMKIHLYTNFTLGAGFGYADLGEDGLKKPEIPPAIKSDFVNGSCRMVLKSMHAEELAYLVVKGIVYLNKEKKIDEQGRKVFINFALETDKTHLNDLSQIFIGLLCNWNNATNYLGSLFNIPYTDNEFNYNVDYKHFIGLINKLYKTTKQCDKSVLNIINKLSCGDSLVVLRGDDKDYFEKMTDDIFSKIPSKINSQKKRYLITESEITKAIEFSEAPEGYQEFCQSIEYCLDNEKSDVAHAISNNKEEMGTTLMEDATEDITMLDNPKKITSNTEDSSDNNEIQNIKDAPIEKTMCNNSFGENKYYYLIGAFALGVAVGYAIEKILS